MYQVQQEFLDMTLAELVANKFNLDKSLLIPSKIDTMNWKAQRPKDSSLDVSLAI